MSKKVALLMGAMGATLLIIAACQQATPAPTATLEPTARPTEPPTEAAPELTGNPGRGGLLYDKWWAVLSAGGPEDDQPLWATQSTNTRSGSTTWRCKECHGWDYKGQDGAYGSGSHFTGFPGVFAAQDKSAAEILAALQGAVNSDHDFSAAMDEQALTDLALFIEQKLIDTGAIIGPDKQALGGDATSGQATFDETCTACHGDLGTILNFGDDVDPEYVGTIAQGNPWEFVHKARFGQPDTPMPAGESAGWTTQDYADLLAYAQTLPAEAATAEGNPVRGGLLYDKWWAVLGVDAPEADQPLWATQSTNTRSGSTTWRCKECHGWDYKGQDGAYSSGSHFTGFPGVLAAQDKSAAEILAALQGAVNSDHDFSAAIDEQALTDLALFIEQKLMDTSAIIGADKQALGGDATSGQATFDGACAACHGDLGTTINFSGDDADPEYVGTIAQGNPWEFIHKTRFGQPGEAMPAGESAGWTTQDYADLLAYAQTLPTKSPLAAAEGGRLYDKWWIAIGAEAPTEDQPLWATQSTNTRDGSTTWRCKECHGWDYKGQDGAYGSGSHYTGFPGVFAAQVKSSDEIVAILSGGINPDHDFSSVLDETAIETLVTFLQEGMVDTQAYINDDKAINGAADHGEALYGSICAGCHGDDGKTINFGDEADPEYIGGLANGNPWEVFHKTLFGQPGEAMPSGLSLGWTLQDVADVLAYAQTLLTD